MVIAGDYLSIETAWIDLRLACLRQRDRAAEALMLDSIRMHAIKQPLLVVTAASQSYILLDGFKRYRCACRLKIGIVPVVVCEGEEKDGILTLLRHNSSRGLSELELGALLDRLHTTYGMTVLQISSHLGCSTGWVGMRLGMVQQMSTLVRGKILSGQFPPRCYLYGVRPFTRVNDNKNILVDRFVGAVSGRGLSTRDIFLLTKAYFSGGRCVRQRIDDGKAIEVLEALRDSPAALSAAGAALVETIAATLTHLERFIGQAAEAHLDNESIALRTHIACGSLLRRIGPFTHCIKELYGKTTETLGSDGIVGRGKEQKTDCTAAQA